MSTGALQPRRATVESDRSLQIVTPPHCRLSLPSSAARWKPPGRH
ncbi:hypothetical protein [Streptomyces sp. NPDC058674]